MQHSYFDVFVYDRGNPLLIWNHDKPCNLGEGIGGAGLFSDGKFSFYPSGTRLYQLEDWDLVVNGH